VSKSPLSPEVFRKCATDGSIERVIVDGFAFPLGAYPVEPMHPKAGYTVQFEPADGDDDEGEWEEWPDRYVFDIVITHDRVEALVWSLLAMMPGRIYPILDVLGHDAYREIDPYISYDLLPLDRFYDALRQFRDFFYEDGMVGFGAMSEEPFFYIFVDEHKIVTVRAATAFKEKIERLLSAYDLEAMPDPAGADSAAHEHRGVLHAPDERPELMTAEEIVEHLREQWNLSLNVDPDRNVDDEGNDLGITPWRCLVRCEKGEPADPQSGVRYAEAILTAGSLREAEDLVFEALEQLIPPEDRDDVDPAIVAMDRIGPEQLLELLRRTDPSAGPIDPTPARVVGSSWLS
jgi:hypothetical protein